MKFKTAFSKMTVCSLILTALFGCGQASQTANGAQDTQSAQTTELTVFAAASMTETLNRIAEDYKTVEPNVSLTFNFASSGDLLSQIKEGADCDVFISAAPKQMNALDGSLKDDADKNPDGLDELLEGTRIDLLENKVVLAVPEGNPKNIDSFDKLADRLGAGEVFLAIGNSDVPVGQYTRKIFAHYGLDEQSLADAGRGSPTARTLRRSPRRSSRARSTAASSTRPTPILQALRASTRRRRICAVRSSIRRLSSETAHTRTRQRHFSTT